MLVFLDFEASSLSKASYPIEVAWVFEDGRSAAHLIRPAPDWTDWDPAAEAIHRIGRQTLERDGAAPAEIAGRMVDALEGHDLRASAPSWDGKWLSVLLRAGGLPRHALRLNDSDDLLIGEALRILRPLVPADRLTPLAEQAVHAALAPFAGKVPAHRALADAEQERAQWLAVRRAAETIAARHRPD